MSEVDHDLALSFDEFIDPTDFEVGLTKENSIAKADRRAWTPPPDTDTKRRNKKTQVKIKHNRRDSKMRN